MTGTRCSTSPLGWSRTSLAVFAGDLMSITLPLLLTELSRQAHVALSDRATSLGAHYVEVPGWGHGGPWEPPDRINPLMLEFLARPAARADQQEPERGDTTTRHRTSSVRNAGCSVTPSAALQSTLPGYPPY
jgi:hypothetical protein